MTTDPTPPASEPAARVEHRGPPLRIAGPILLVVAAFVAGGIVIGIASASGVSDNTANAVGGFVVGGGILAFALAYLHGYAPNVRRGIVGWKRHLGAAIGIGLATGFAMRLVAGAITLLGQKLNPDLEEKFEEIGRDLVPPETWQKLLLVVGLVVLAPLGEELLFRGLLLRGLTYRMPFGWAAVISSVLFALAHLSYWELWPATLSVFAFGLAAAWIYRWYGYVASVTAHMLFNGFAAVFVFVDPDRFTSSYLGGWLPF